MKLVALAVYQIKEINEDGKAKLAASRSIMLNIESIVSIEHIAYKQEYLTDPTEYYLVKTTRHAYDLIVSEIGYKHILSAQN